MGRILNGYVMRFLRIKALRLMFYVLCVGLLSLCLSSNSVAGNIKMLMHSSVLAGSQYYALAKVWSDVRVGDRLTLSREPQNRHDPKAIRVEWRGEQLGYVPRAANRAVAAALDAGEKLEARISKLRDPLDYPNPWQRLEFEIYLVL